MTSIVRFTAAAEADIEQAAAWYERQRPGLALDFLKAVTEVVERIADHPKQFRKVVANVRRANLEGFPYGAWYRIEPDESVIIACLHHRRDPRLITDRLPEPKP